MLQSADASPGGRRESRAVVGYIFLRTTLSKNPPFQCFQKEVFNE